MDDREPVNLRCAVLVLRQRSFLWMGSRRLGSVRPLRGTSAVMRARFEPDEIDGGRPPHLLEMCGAQLAMTAKR
jgi:hypothetical protein